MVEAVTEIIEDYQRCLVCNVVAYRAIGRQASGLIRRGPGIELQNFTGDRIEAALRDLPVCKKLPRPGPIGIASSAQRIVERISEPIEGEVAQLHGVCRHSGVGNLLDFFLLETLPAPDEECLVAAVVQLGNVHRTADGGIGKQEIGWQSIGPSGARSAGSILIEKSPVLHPAAAAELGNHAMKFVGACFLDRKSTRLN